MNDESKNLMPTEGNEDSIDINLNEECEVSTAVIGPPVIGIIAGE